MAVTEVHRTGTRTALYLRCYPYDSWRMDLHRRALEEHAREIGLGSPHVYLDNGSSSGALKPELRRLLGQAALGRVTEVLVPGRWVFSLDGRTADSVVAFLRGVGVAVVELPQRESRSSHRLAS
ncbi:hypothetical protein [Kitasatospora sp. NPDC051914]|uniref:hypothetical protein n=1 Tax=Kitasatospora sp. NPDC051914 TaxID=3154945 RepID=UPI0034341959